jgi:hypothetical protein
MLPETSSDAPSTHFAGAYERLGRASLPVRTRTLTESGVERLRILSESKLIELLQAMVTETLADVRSAAVLPPAFPAAAVDPGGSPEDLEKAYQGQWNELRGKHEKSLRRIEGRMEKLAKVFRGLEGAFSRLDGPGAPAAEPGTEPDLASEAKQKQLLREMLLRREG